jgi:MFS family permease
MSFSARRFSGQFWALVGATFLGFLGIGTVLPLLAPHVRYDLHGTDQDVGLIIGVFSFVALAGRLIAGPLADRRGRKISFLCGLVCCGLAGGTYLLPLGMTGPYLARVLQGMGEACLYTGAAAWVVEAAGIERSAQALGYLSSGIWGGISAGPMIGQWLGTFERAAMMQVVFAAVAFAILTRVPEHYHPEPHAEKRNWLPRSMIAPGIAIGFVNVQFPVVGGFLILHLRSHGNSGPMAFSAYAGMILLSRFFLGGLPDRISPAITFYGGITCMAAGLTILAAGPGPAVAIGATALLGFGFSFPWSSIASTVLRRTPNSGRGSAVGILSAFYDLFVGISSFTAGWVAHRFNYSAAFLMAAVALVAAAVAGKFVFVEARPVWPAGVPVEAALDEAEEDLVS